MTDKYLDLDELTEFAKSYKLPDKLPISYNPDHYTRTPLYKNDYLEIVLICFEKGQSSSIHDHQGSNCIVRVISGKLLETLFDENKEYLFSDKPANYSYSSHHDISEGDISGLDGTQVHQLSCLNGTGSVLVNFYSPPFKV
jgi:cysteine dioxygenase